MQSKGGWYSVQTGRRDGLVSLAKNVNLPGPSISVENSAAIFNSKGISTEDMVHLLGIVHISSLYLFLTFKLVMEDSE